MIQNINIFTLQFEFKFLLAKNDFIVALNESYIGSRVKKVSSYINRITRFVTKNGLQFVWNIITKKTKIKIKVSKI